ncbi:MAG: hypothetical protein ABFD44_10490 [Anaerolineaceae bacterium]
MDQPGFVVYLAFPAEENAREAAWELAAMGLAVDLEPGMNEGGWGLAVHLRAGEEPASAVENMQPVIEDYDGLLDHWDLDGNEEDEEE